MDVVAEDRLDRIIGRTIELCFGIRRRIEVDMDYIVHPIPFGIKCGFRLDNLTVYLSVRWTITGQPS